MTDSSMTLIAGAAPMLDTVNARAAEILAAAREVASKAAQPGDSSNTTTANALDQSLQAVIHVAVQQGATDRNVFVGLSTAIAYFLLAQDMGEAHVVAERLGKGSLTVAGSAAEAAGYGFATRGNA